jgi:hypothetical protein
MIKSITRKTNYEEQKAGKKKHKRQNSYRNGRAFCLILIDQALNDTIQKYWPTELNHFHASISSNYLYEVL